MFDICYDCHYSGSQNSFWVDYGAYIILALTYLVSYSVYRYTQYIKRRKQKILLVTCLHENIHDLRKYLDGLEALSSQMLDMNEDSYVYKNIEFSIANIEELMNLETYQLIENKNMEEDIRVYSDIKSSIRNISQNYLVLLGKKDVYTSMITERRVEMDRSLVAMRDKRLIDLVPAGVQVLTAYPQLGPILEEFANIYVRWANKLKAEQGGVENPTWTRTDSNAFAEESIAYMNANQMLFLGRDFVEYYLLLTKYIEAYRNAEFIQKSISKEIKYYHGLFSEYLQTLERCYKHF